MNAHAELDEDSTENRRICSECIGERYLKQVIVDIGVAAQCFYCEKTGNTISVGDLADRVELVFKTHYQQTASEPTSSQSAVMNDPESSYSWEREGQSVADVITDITVIDDQAADDTHEVLNDRHYDFEGATAGDEGEFDGDVMYERRQPDDERLRKTWSTFQNTLKTEARIFNRTAESALDEIFSDLSKHGTKEGAPAVVIAGPGQRIATLFRARVLVSNDSVLIRAIERPDKEVGPPPSTAAKAGRMNSRGISVFYGATHEPIAIAEVRPPVGSRVAVACFKIVRPLYLLNLEALRSLYVTGSLFDPTYIHRLEKAQFLRRLSAEITMPVMPEDEPSNYLVTQAIADYLAGRADAIDGIIYPSTQVSAGEGTNVVLFHKSSRVEALDIAPDTRIQSHANFHDDDDAPSYGVSVTGRPNSDSKKYIDRYPYTSVPAAVWGGEVDPREPALQIDVNSLRIHHISGVSVQSKAFKVSRRYSREPVGNLDLL